MKKYAIVFTALSIQRTVFAYNGTATSGGLFYEVRGSGVAIIDCVSSQEQCVIPSAIDGKPVNEIGDWAFYGCRDLRSIEISESVKLIGEHSFCNCDSLETISVENANNNFSAVSGVLFNKNKTELLKYPESKSGQNFIVPESVRKIGDRAFSGNKNLLSVELPSSATEIGVSAFRGCEMLKSINLPDGLSEIKLGMFWGCNSIESVTIPSTISKISEYGFYDCANLSTVFFNGSKPEIKNYAFVGQEKTVDGFYKKDSQGWSSGQQIQSLAMSMQKALIYEAGVDADVKSYVDNLVGNGGASTGSISKKIADSVYCLGLSEIPASEPIINISELKIDDAKISIEAQISVENGTLKFAANQQGNFTIEKFGSENQQWIALPNAGVFESSTGKIYFEMSASEKSGMFRVRVFK